MLVQEDGEAMQVKEEDIEDLLQQFYEENF